MRFSPLFFVCTAFLVTDPGWAAGNGASVGKAPSWVKATGYEVPQTVPRDQIDDGTYFLLVDKQARVDDGTETHYTRFVTKVINEHGVQSSGQVTVVFDPAYQKLTLHTLRVVRDGQVIEQLDPKRITLLQREEELESQIYDGSLTASLVLSDVRIGDVVDYSYSVQGANPIFGGRYSSGLEFQWRVPVERLHYRLLWPAKRHLTIRSHKGEFPPMVSRRGDYDEYLWEREAITPLIPDEKTPEWYDPFPWVQFTEWSSWAEVVQWGLPLYRVPDDYSEALQGVIRTVSQERDGARRVIAALRFVQDQIRYLGIETGTGSHEPRDPSTVLEQRFGDCKDKSLLLVTLLRAVGIEAAPALVNSYTRKTVAERAPTPLAFNHVIVRAVVDGTAYWLDPTTLYQRGDLAHLAQPEFGAALVLETKADDLVMFDSVQRVAGTSPTREIVETYDLRGGMSAPGTYTISTVYREHAADWMRGWLARTSRDEVVRQYLKYYTKRIPNISAKEPLRTEDDEQTNTLVVTEVYSVPDLSEGKSDGNIVRFIPNELNDDITAPTSVKRTMPLKGEMPRHFAHTSRILLPEPWDIKPGTATVTNDYFDFRRAVSYEENQLTIRYEMVRKADYIVPEKAEDYAAQVNQVQDKLGYQLTWQDRPAAPSPGANWTNIGVALTAVGLAILLGWRIYRWDPPLAIAPAHPGLQGLRGWLALLGFVLIAGAVRRVFQLATLGETYFASGTHLAGSTSPLLDMIFNWLIMTEITGNFLLVGGNLLAIVLYFQKRQAFRRFVTWYFIASIGFLIFDQVAFGLVAPETQNVKEYSDTARNVFSAAVWLWYVSVSKRASSTFVERLATSPTQAPAVLAVATDNKI